MTERVEQLRREAAERARGRELLLYHRRSEWVRVLIEGGDDGRLESATGIDEGSALSVWPGQGRPIGFASSTGLGTDGVHWMLDHAVEGGQRCDARPWASPVEPLRGDLDERAGLPSIGELADWLDDARRALRTALPSASATPGASRDRLRRASVDVARTVESWAAEGWTARRERARAWARAHPALDGEGPDPPALAVAARSFAELPREAWAELLADRSPGRGSEREALDGRTPLLAGPEAAARLVLALVASIHTGRDRTGLAVGPGWRLLDDPLDRTALYGALFDDCGFPARRDPLADGRTVSRGLSGLRRPSFRDRPATLPFHVVVEPPALAPPERGWLVSGARIHPLGERWAIDLDGAELRDGRPWRRVRGTLETTPEALVARCRGGVGPARVSHLGVVTPALVFAGARES